MDATNGETIMMEDMDTEYRSLKSLKVIAIIVT